MIPREVLESSAGADHNDPHVAEVVRFFRALFGEGMQENATRYLDIVSATHIDGKNLGGLKDRYFEWPRRANAAAAHALAQDQRGKEVYFCAHLLKDKRRKKEFAAPIRCLYSDADAADLSRDPKPSIIVETSPGSYHAYWLLRESLAPARAEELNKRQACAIGENNGGHDLTQILRVPYTHNRKPKHAVGGEPPLVRLVEFRSDVTYDPQDLERKLPSLPAPKSVEVLTECDDEPPVRLSGFDLRLWCGETDALARYTHEDVVDRSKVLYALGLALAKAGATKSTIVTALRDRDRKLGLHKYDEHPEEYERIAEKVLLELERRSEEFAPPPSRTLAEILEHPSPPPAFIVQELFIEGVINLIAGAPYAGKSLVACEIAAALASGTPAFCHFAVPASKRVMYVIGEQGIALAEQRLASAAQTRPNLTDDWKQRLSLWDATGLDFSKPEDQRKLVAEAKRKGAEVVVLDSKTALYGEEDENDASSSRKSVRAPLQQLLADGITPILVHHSAKDAEKNEPGRARQLVRGSGDLIAMTGSIVGLWRAPDGRAKVLVDSRAGDAPPFAIKANMTVQQHLRKLPPTLEYAGPWNAATQDRVRELILTCPQGATAKEMAQTLEVAPKTVQRYVRNLLAKGTIESKGRGASTRYVPVGIATSDVADEPEQASSILDDTRDSAHRDIATPYRKAENVAIPVNTLRHPLSEPKTVHDRDMGCRNSNPLPDKGLSSNRDIATKLCRDPGVSAAAKPTASDATADGWKESEVEVA